MKSPWPFHFHRAVRLSRQRGFEMSLTCTLPASTLSELTFQSELCPALHELPVPSMYGAACVGHSEPRGGEHIKQENCGERHATASETTAQANQLSALGLSAIMPDGISQVMGRRRKGREKV